MVPKILNDDYHYAGKYLHFDMQIFNICNHILFFIIFYYYYYYCTLQYIQTKLEQLERLRSEDTPRRLMITHTIESYWIPSQKKTKSKSQIKKNRQNFKFLNFEMGITRDTLSEVAW